MVALREGTKYQGRDVCLYWIRTVHTHSFNGYLHLSKMGLTALLFNHVISHVSKVGKIDLEDSSIQLKRLTLKPFHLSIPIKFRITI